MIRRLASLGLCLGLTSTALAESGAAPVRLGVPPEIPSGGVLPITATCYDAGCAALASVFVAEVGGAGIDGHFELMQGEGYERWGYFVPSEPFRPGAQYSVRSALYAYATSLVAVSAAESGVLDENSLGVTAELSRERLSRDAVCCPAPQTKVPQRCLDLGTVSQVALTVTLSAGKPSTTQYVYNLSMYAQGDAAGSPDAAFAPLLNDLRSGPRTARFDGTADSYCYTLRARPIVGGDTTTLATRCIENAFASTGQVGRSPEEIAQWRTTCEVTPEPVDAGTLPGDQVDASLDADGEPLGRGDESSIIRERSGCQLAGSTPRAGDIVGWLLVMVAAIARRRRVG